MDQEEEGDSAPVCIQLYSEWPHHQPTGADDSAALLPQQEAVQTNQLQDCVFPLVQ